MTKRVQLLISGRVQGVNFRNSLLVAAVGNGLTGWVRNLPDGRVEAVVEGPEKALRAVIAWCHQGPPLAQPTGVTEKWSAATGEFDGFIIKR